jgi:hypothetical protein
LEVLMRLRSFHRWHALAMSLVVIGSASSGLIHTWMARTQAPPPPARPAGEVELSVVTVPPSALPGPAAGVSLRSIDHKPWYQVIPAGGGPLRWFDAATGVEDAAADARYASEIAARALGGVAVQQTGYLTAFDSEYIAIFRILPVYRFEADGGPLQASGTRVYVSTMTGSVTRLTDDAKQAEANLFTYVHKWGFIRNRAVRDWALMLAMGSLIALAGSGLVLFWRTRRTAR